MCIKDKIQQNSCVLLYIRARKATKTEGSQRGWKGTKIGATNLVLLLNSIAHIGQQI